MVDKIKELECFCWMHPVIGKGRHCLSCPIGGGPKRVHDSVRDEVYNMYRSAGLVARTEVKDMLPDNGDIPGDIVVEGMPNTGNGLVIDVTVTDSRTITEGDSLVSLQRRASTVGVEAREREDFKRNKKGGAGNVRMQDRVRAIGYRFCPIAFEVEVGRYVEQKFKTTQ